jgi:hypothetical protein
MCTGAKNSNGGYPTEFAGSAQNPKKNIGTSNQPMKTKIFPKKSMFSILNIKEPKIRMGATRRNSRAPLKILKKISEHQISHSKRKFSKSKLCLVP